MSRNITDGVKSGTLCVVLTSRVALNAPSKTLIASLCSKDLIITSHTRRKRSLQGSGRLPCIEVSTFRLRKSKKFSDEKHILE